MIPFADWLLAELEYRGWSRSETARRGGISASLIDQVTNGIGNPGIGFCRGIARAFDMPLEDVLRLRAPG